VIRVLVAAASPVARAGLESIIAHDPTMIVVGSEGGDVAATLAEEIATHEPDVLVIEGALDDELPSVVGEDEHGAHGPAVVILTQDVDSSRAQALLRTGARSLLPHDASVTEILAAVAAAAAGLVSMPRVWMTDMLAPPAASRVVARAPDVDAPVLTPREVEVLRMIAEGLANKQIAGRLGISEHTVKFHVAAVFEKLHASSRAEAVMIGARRGLIVL